MEHGMDHIWRISGRDQKRDLGPSSKEYRLQKLEGVDPAGM
jgi:hypothetical protein